jgi:hypothetical protein
MYWQGYEISLKLELPGVARCQAVRKLHQLLFYEFILRD